MRLRRTVRLSLRALLTHRVRTTLAISSVAVGVMAVVLTSAVGTGVQNDVQRRIESMGVNLLVVRPALVKRFVGRKEIKGTATTLRLDDYSAIAEVPLVANAAPGIEGSVKVKAGAFSTTTRVLGTTAAFPAIRRFELQSGQFFDADDDQSARRVAVLGARVAKALFDDDPVGREVRIRGVPFNVVGVLAAKGTLADGDEDNQVVIPVRTAQRRVFNVNWLNAVFVSVEEPDAVLAVEAAIGTILQGRHRLGRDGTADFEIQNATRFFTLQRQMADSLNGLSTGLAGVTLLIGGTGIMGLMLLSVKERTREIGLRMAVGARPRDVLIQFLSEATVLALGGWTIGLVLGAIAVVAVKLTTDWQIAAPVQAVLASLGMALIIGVGFGAMPARNASTIPPVRALLAK